MLEVGVKDMLVLYWDFGLKREKFSHSLTQSYCVMEYHQKSSHIMKKHLARQNSEFQARKILIDTHGTSAGPSTQVSQELPSSCF